jgi:3-methylcrotonyl-CoA carboxylase alpha subunit
MMIKIKKILIANRGEIACRVMKTCRKMGIGSVAVYSDADRKALHVRMADEAVHIGASPATESYLVIDKIIAACKSSGADAVHPGYGFLSENPEFARRLKQENITFIGPSPESMEAMGLKDAAKKLMEKTGVPVTPGYHGKDQNAKLLKAKAGMIGYPVLIKAVAGGGGKGMRKVERAEDFDDALASCMREAKSAFGDDRVLIEKYILSPRHIEVQVFGDTHGNVVHMYERDCSLQRRHQKVIEEAPAPGMTRDVRAAMTKAAIEAAKAVDYVGAGTVEFIVDGSGKLRTDGFWFMEMNTRLQVEHPVTEMITGLDLVELQIRVAQGEKLPKQSEIKMEGHAVEARIYAEDPANDFLPSIGKIWCFDDTDWRSNDEGEGGYRIDPGLDIKSQVSIYYDPMIAKIIGFSMDRDEAIDNAAYGIDEAEISGLKTNTAFLVNCLRHQGFLDGKIHTGFIPENMEELIGIDVEARDEVYGLAALYILMQYDNPQNHPRTPFTTLDGWRSNANTRMSFTFLRKDTPIQVDVLSVEEEMFAKLQVNDNEIFTISLAPLTDAQTGSLDKTLKTSLNLYDAWAYKLKDDHISLFRKGVAIKVMLPTFDSSSNTTGGNTITAPMPGKIIAVNISVGDSVNAGDKLIIMEAMKMEMSLEAPRDGVVAAVHICADALVSDGEVLLELEPEDA